MYSRRETQTFAATGNGPLPLSPRGSARLLRRLFDVRNVRVVEVQGERVGHGYGETGGNHYGRGSSARIGRVLARSAIDTVAPTLLFSSTSWSLGPSWPWSDVTADPGGLVETLLSRPHLRNGRNVLSPMESHVSTKH